MNKFSEKTTQKKVIEYFKNLGYIDLGNKQHSHNINLEENLIKAHLQKQGYSDTLINHAYRNLYATSRLSSANNLYNINKEVYTLLRYGTKLQETGKPNQTIHFIDWENPENNTFYIAEEVTVQESKNRRPDIVLYVNGIALAVLELKSAIVSVEEGIRQNIENYNHNIPEFFTTIQFVFAGNEAQGLRYGTIQTPEKFYNTWKEDGDTKSTTNLWEHLTQFGTKERFLNLIHDFILFDAGIKKICRPHQYYGIKAIQKALLQQKGGIIWHTQGSGKSLTMIWLTQWIQENFPNARILIITDRTELDGQIHRNFHNTGEKKLKQSLSAQDLIRLLDSSENKMICALIHKFGYADKSKNFTDELTKVLPPNFNPQGDFFVFVDECHRTQSGDLHQAMKNILPENNTIFLGFTGTPLLKKDKNKKSYDSRSLFGDYIHTYKFNQAVKDKVVLDLRYEARHVEQYISSPEKIESWFESKTQGLTDIAKERLQDKWATMKSLLSSTNRLEIIAREIYIDFDKYPRLAHGVGNAMLVANSIYDACLYYEIFQRIGLKKCAVVTSFDPNNTNHNDTGEDTPSLETKKKEIYQIMLQNKTITQFEEWARKTFINEPSQMQLLIVVDKLLVGFDAPKATYLYIDKSLQDHGLFQAICRVNRLDDETKDYGYIIDYQDLFFNIKNSMDDYTIGAFEAFEKEDIKGLLKTNLEYAKNDLDQALIMLEELFKAVNINNFESVKEYFIGENSQDPEYIEKRSQVYKCIATLIRAYAKISSAMSQLKISKTEQSTITKQVREYTQIRKTLELSSGDYIDLIKHEPDMKFLIDTYVKANDGQLLSKLEGMTFVEILLSNDKQLLEELPLIFDGNESLAAEAIEENIRRVITQDTLSNPYLYQRLSEKLEELIKLRKENAIVYKECLDNFLEYCKDIHSDNSYPVSITKLGARALYDIIKDENVVLNLDVFIKKEKPDDWKKDSSGIKKKKFQKEVSSYISDNSNFDYIQISKIFDTIVSQDDYN